MRFYPLNLGPYPSPPAPPSRASTLREPPTAAARLSPGVAACAPPLSRCSCWVPCVSPRSAWLARLFPERSILGPPSQAPCKVRTLALSLPKRSSTLLPSVSIRLPNPQTRAAGSGARAPLSPRAPPSPTLALASRASLPLARAPLQVQNRTPPHPPPGWLSFFLVMARWYPAPLGPESSAPAPCSAGSTSADSRVVGAAVSHIAALLIAEAARGPRAAQGRSRPEQQRPSTAPPCRARSALDLPCAQGTAATAVRASARGRIGAPPRGAGAGVLLGAGGGQAPTLSSRPGAAEAAGLTAPLHVTELFLLFTPIHPIRASLVAQW